jgi:hypothetical protein
MNYSTAGGVINFQEIFDKVAKHLLGQGKRAINEETDECCYHTGGLSCAVGCLITSDAYHTRLEGNTIKSSMVQKALAQSLGLEITDFGEVFIDLLRDLQRIHDDSELENWSRDLSAVAKKFNLKFVFDEMGEPS